MKAENEGPKLAGARGWPERLTGIDLRYPSFSLFVALTLSIPESLPVSIYHCTTTLSIPFRSPDPSVLDGAGPASARHFSCLGEAMEDLETSYGTRVEYLPLTTLRFLNVKDGKKIESNQSSIQTEAADSKIVDSK